jgi:hypothetical protein
VLIVACATAESYAIVEDSERPLKILNIRPEQQNICRTVIASASASARDLGICTVPLLEI